MTMTACLHARNRLQHAAHRVCAKCDGTPGDSVDRIVVSALLQMLRQVPASDSGATCTCSVMHELLPYIMHQHDRRAVEHEQ